MLCKMPENIDRVFVQCRDVNPFWGVLQRALKKDIYISPHNIAYIPIRKNVSLKYDVLVIFELYSTWLSRVSVRHANCVTNPKAVINMQGDVAPEWSSVLTDLLDAKQSFVA